MTPPSLWKWIALPAVLVVGVVGGSAATMLAMTRIGEPRRSEPLPSVAVAPPTPAPGVGPFKLGDRPPTPNGMPEAGAPPVEEPLISDLSPEIPQFNPPPGYFDPPAAPNKGDGTDPPIIKPGQVLAVEVLEALPGRPLTGERVVRPDGTISLGFYGDLQVAGLNRFQAKVKLVELLRKFITDETLGLFQLDATTNKYKLVPPVESHRIFIDESANFHPGGPEKATRPLTTLHPDAALNRINEIEGKLDAVLKELKELKALPEAGNPSHPPAPAPR